MFRLTEGYISLVRVFICIYTLFMLYVRLYCNFVTFMITQNDSEAYASEFQEFVEWIVHVLYDTVSFL